MKINSQSKNFWFIDDFQLGEIFECVSSLSESFSQVVNRRFQILTQLHLSNLLRISQSKFQSMWHLFKDWISPYFHLFKKNQLTDKYLTLWCRVKKKETYSLWMENQFHWNLNDLNWVLRSNEGWPIDCSEVNPFNQATKGKECKECVDSTEVSITFNFDVHAC